MRGLSHVPSVTKWTERRSDADWRRNSDWRRLSSVTSTPLTPQNSIQLNISIWFRKSFNLAYRISNRTLTFWLVEGNVSFLSIRLNRSDANNQTATEMILNLELSRGHLSFIPTCTPPKSDKRDICTATTWLNCRHCCWQKPINRSNSTKFKTDNPV